MKKATVVKETSWCCWGGRRKFPTFAVIVLIIGVSWLLNDLKILSFEIPWLPLILIILAVGWIFDNYSKR